MCPDFAAREAALESLRRPHQAARQEEACAVGHWQTTTGSDILFSAPHEVTHTRDGATKIAESGTAELAFALARELGGSAIATVGAQLGDPNWDIGHPFVSRAASLAADNRPVVDLHMMRPRGTDLCVGLGPRPQLADDLWFPIVDEAVRSGLRVSVNWPFAGSSRTVSGQLQERDISAIQVELTWDCFAPNEPSMTRAWTALARGCFRIVEARAKRHSRPGGSGH